MPDSTLVIGNCQALALANSLELTTGTDASFIITHESHEVGVYSLSNWLSYSPIFPLYPYCVERMGMNYNCPQIKPPGKDRCLEPGELVTAFYDAYRAQDSDSLEQSISGKLGRRVAAG